MDYTVYAELKSKVISKVKADIRDRESLKSYAKRFATQVDEIFDIGTSVVTHRAVGFQDGAYRFALDVRFVAENRNISFSVDFNARLKGNGVSITCEETNECSDVDLASLQLGTAFLQAATLLEKPLRGAVEKFVEAPVSESY